MKVLLVKTSSMGDVIHTFPAVTDLFAAKRDVTLDWLVEEPFAPLARLHPAVRDIIPVAMRRWRKSPVAARTWQDVRTLRQKLRSERYDLVVDAQGLLKSVVLARLAGAPVEGLDAASVREPLAARFYRKGYSVSRDRHAIQRTRALFGQVFGYAPDLGRLDHGIPQPQPADPPSVFLLHGTSREDKKWPVGDWIETARLLLAKGLAPVTTWSSPAEKSVAEAIAAAVPETTVLEKMPLGALARRLGQSSLVIGADTGLTHLATAYGIPTVAVFVATRPGLTGPLGPKAIALTLASGARIDAGSGMLPREIRCERITPGAVVEAAEALLQETAR